ncbi:MAG: hypothetical protein ACMUJM_19985 [bacterium]
MWKIIKFLFKLVKITLIALATSFLIFALVWILVAIVLFPFELIFKISLPGDIKSLYEQWGFQVIFGIQYIGLIYSSLKGKGSRYWLKKIFKKKKGVTEISQEDLESYYEKYQGIDRKIDAQLKKISQINQMYRSYILEKLNKNELLYSRTYKTLLDLNGFFDNKLEVLKKNYELQKTIKGSEHFAGQVKHTSHTIEATYNEMDEKMKQLTSLILEFNPQKKALDYDSDYINSETTKMLDIFKNI